MSKYVQMHMWIGIGCLLCNKEIKEGERYAFVAEGAVVHEECCLDC